MPTKYTSLIRYSKWDGTQVPQINADQILDALSDDLMEFGDLQQSMRYLMQRGMNTEDGNYISGLRDLLRQLKDQRNQQLERYDMNSVMEDIKQKLDEILAMERETIEEWIDREDANRGAERFMDDLMKNVDDQPAGAESQSRENNVGNEPPQQGSQSESSRQTDDEGNFSDQVIRNIGKQNQEYLNNLPDDAAGKIRQLENYEFLNTDAQRKFLELLNQLRQQMAQNFFNDIENMINNMSPDDMQRMKDMVHDLNEMMEKRANGEDHDFDEFMDQYGDMFGDNPPQSIDELIEQMQQQMAASQAMMNSMSPDQQQQLMDMMGDRFTDPDLNQELSQLAQMLAQERGQQGRRYNFSGDQDIDMQAARELMRELQRMDELEQQMQRSQYDGKVDSINPDLVEELMGEEARKNLEEMQELMKVLEEAGYARKDGNKWELTPRGSRTLGQKALGEIYQRLKKQSLGNHAVPEEGRFGERIEESKPYEFGDPFHLHMPRTIRNALDREGKGSPIKLSIDDFEIYRSELITQTATVLMVDLSWSMALRGSFQSAKKVALALHNLISTAYPRDSLYVLGFSALATEIKSHDLPYLQYEDYLLGTNMQHALILAEKLLDKHQQGTKQVIMITDGEPTAHLENGGHKFQYPPTPTTINKTLRAVRSCTQKGITINTFMLDQSYYLKEFVDQMTRINGGRVFYTDPQSLGEYILVDYVQNKKKRLGRG